MHILYIHGFNRPPNNKHTKSFLEKMYEYHSPELIDSPTLEHQKFSEVMIKINQILDMSQSKIKIVIGDSIGGLIAHKIKQERTDINKVILINPVLDFKAVMKKFPRDHICAKTRKKIIITDDIVLNINNGIPKTKKDQQDYLLLLQKDDSICMYEDAIKCLPKAKRNIKTGQGHLYVKFDESYKVINDFINPHERLTNMTKTNRQTLG